jgi:hypothetical protein
MSPMNEPFDPTKPVQCRNGRKARIICADAKHQNFPIVALVDRDGVGECPVNFTKDGLEFIGRDSDLDLINTPPPPPQPDPAEQAWEKYYSPKSKFHASSDYRDAFLAGWKARGEK